MEISRQPEHISAPICSECGVEMAWIRSLLVEADAMVNMFACRRCDRTNETKTPAMTAKE